MVNDFDRADFERYVLEVNQDPMAIQYDPKNPEDAELLTVDAKMGKNLMQILEM